MSSANSWLEEEWINVALKFDAPITDALHHVIKVVPAINEMGLVAFIAKIVRVGTSIVKLKNGVVPTFPEESVQLTVQLYCPDGR